MDPKQIIDNVKGLGGSRSLDLEGNIVVDIPKEYKHVLHPMLKKAKQCIVDELRPRALPRATSPREATGLVCTLCGGLINIQKTTQPEWYLFWCSCRKEPWFCNKQDWEGFAEAQKGTRPVQ